MQWYCKFETRICWTYKRKLEALQLTEFTREGKTLFLLNIYLLRLILFLHTAYSNHIFIYSGKCQSTQNIFIQIQSRWFDSFDIFFFEYNQSILNIIIVIFSAFKELVFIFVAMFETSNDSLNLKSGSTFSLAFKVESPMYFHLKVLNFIYLLLLCLFRQNVNCKDMWSLL